MEHPVTLWLSEEEYAALLATAARFHRTPEVQLRAWTEEALTEAGRHFHVDRWEARKKRLEADPVLAATVDAAVEAQR